MLINRVQLRKNYWFNADGCYTARTTEIRELFYKRIPAHRLCFAGNNKETKVFFKEMIKEPYWGGVKKISKELSTSGEFRFNVYHQSTKTLIYSKGYNTLFNEWQTTAEASTMERVFAMSAIFPYPKENVTFVTKGYQMEVNPTYYNALFQLILYT